MANVTGPTSKLPGDLCRLPAGTMCDEHPDVLAVVRMTGECDSWGSEEIDLCQACVDHDKEMEEAEKLIPKHCEWCKTESLTVRPTRDWEEGTSGPVYDLCSPCRQKNLQRAHDEMDDCDDDDD